MLLGQCLTGRFLRCYALTCCDASFRYESFVFNFPLQMKSASELYEQSILMVCPILTQFRGSGDAGLLYRRTWSPVL